MGVSGGCPVKKEVNALTLSCVYDLFLASALLAYKLGEFQEAYNLAIKSEEIYPDHAETKELLKTLRQYLLS